MPADEKQNQLIQLKKGKADLISPLIQEIFKQKILENSSNSIPEGKQEENNFQITQEYPNQTIYHHIKKWIAEPTNDSAKQNFPYGVEVWSYEEGIDLDNALFVGDFAKARFQSIYEATKELLQGKPEFQKLIEGKYNTIIEELKKRLQGAAETELGKRIEITQKAIDIFYTSAIHLIAYADKNTAYHTTTLRDLTEKDWENAKNKLKEKEQVHIPDYAKRDILILDKKTGKFEYYKRNYFSDQLPEEHTKQFPGTKNEKGKLIKPVPTIPSHHRVVGGIPNYARVFYGTFDGNSATVDHVGGRHGTLVPYDLYKKKNGKKTSVHEIRWMAFKNMVDVLKDDVIALGNENKEIKNRNRPLTHRYIHLISPAIGGAVNSFEKEQFRDMRYGAYALHGEFTQDLRIETSEGSGLQSFSINVPHINFSYFCAGVNPLRRFTDEKQQTVNNLAIINLYEESFPSEIPENLKDSDQNSNRIKHQSAFGKLTIAAKKYIRKLDSHKENFDENDKALKELAVQVDREEKNVYKTSKAYLSELKEKWEKKEWEKEIQNEKDETKKAKLTTFYLIYQLYDHAARVGNITFSNLFGKSWTNNKAKGLLQALIGFLTELNGDFYSKGCKSGADRATLVATLIKRLVDIYHDRKLSDSKKIDEMIKAVNEDLDRAYVINGSHPLVKFDNRGAPSKQKIGTKSAPYVKLSKSAAHMQAKKKIKDIMQARSLFSERQLEVAATREIVNARPAGNAQKVPEIVEQAIVQKSLIGRKAKIIREAKGKFNAIQGASNLKDLRSKIYEVLELYTSKPGMFSTRNRHIEEFINRTKDLNLEKPIEFHKFILLLWQHYSLIEDESSLLKALYKLSLIKFLTDVSGKNIPEEIKGQAFMDLVLKTAIEESDSKKAYQVKLDKEEQAPPAAEAKKEDIEQTEIKGKQKKLLAALSLTIYRHIDKLITSNSYRLNNAVHQNELNHAYNIVDIINNYFVNKKTENGIMDDLKNASYASKSEVLKKAVDLFSKEWDEVKEEKENLKTTMHLAA